MVGLGVMGAAMAAQLLRSGVPVIGYDVAPDRAAALGAMGGTSADSATEVARSCAVVCTSLPTARALDDVVEEIGAAQHDCLVVELSTFALADKQRARAMLAEGGARLVDSPVSGTGAQAAVGDLVAFVSGDDVDDRALALRTVAGFTRAAYDVGAFGNGIRFKLVANLLVAVHNVAAAEALVLAERASLDSDLVLEAIGAGAGSSRMFEVRGPKVVARDYDPTVRLEVFLKDLDLIAAFAADLGVSTPMLDASRRMYDEARDRGWTDADPVRVAELLRESLELREIR
jgi:3-hydroxyisobutyrate dehydrogenase-like beta-hydroxyacid dehydrogenase